MREFGIYTLKSSYINRYMGVDNNLASYKGAVRPFICVKLSGQNWLIPCASLNPNDRLYKRKYNKYLGFSNIDKKQQNRALHIFKDITKQSSDPKFMSVIKYFNAIPVQHKDCNKYRENVSGTNQHIIVEKQLQSLIKGTLIRYLKEYKENKYVGFIKAKVEAGQKSFEDYPIRCYDIKQEIYKKQTLHKAVREFERLNHIEKENQSKIVKLTRSTVKKDNIKSSSDLPKDFKFKEIEELNCYPIPKPVLEKHSREPVNEDKTFVLKRNDGFDYVLVKLPALDETQQTAKQPMFLKFTDIKLKNTGEGLKVTHASEKLINSTNIKQANLMLPVKNRQM